MKLKYILCSSMLLMLMCTSAYAVFSSNKYPDYIQDSIDKVSTSMSNSYGESHCDAFRKSETLWYLDCKPESENITLEFEVYPAAEAPYSIATPFYLIAKNQFAKEASEMNPNESLLSYLLINTAEN